MDELIAYAQLIMEYLQTNGANINFESQQALGQFLQQIFEIIAAQQQGGAPQAPRPPIPQGMPSSNIAGSQYDPETGQMRVQFLGKYPNRNGPEYQYENVPPIIAELVQSGAVPARTLGRNSWGSWFPGKHPSAGASVNTLLKETNLPYQRVS